MVAIVREEGKMVKNHQQVLKRPLQATPRKGFMRGKGGPENTSCPYKGVRQRTWGKWVAEIREPNNGPRFWLGTFTTSLEAAVAYDAAAQKLYGSNAMLNLPDAVITSAQQMADHINNAQIQYLGDHMNIPDQSLGTEIPNVQNPPSHMQMQDQMDIPQSLGTEIPNVQNPLSQMHMQEQTEDQNKVLDINDFIDCVDLDLDLNIPVETTTAHQGGGGGGDQAAVYGGNINYHQESTSDDWLEFVAAGLGDLDLNLPKFKYSTIWDEAAATLDFELEINDPGVFVTSFDEGIKIGTY